ncbi:MAG: UDP-N-acetylmuramate dehydrogenase [Halieaceae bacterium]|nr:UDP-N-acetylmuramate dehydrogenase [Halieaceae bacterium]
MHIRRDEPLQKLNTLALQARASAFARVQDEAQLKRSLASAKELDLEVVVLGRGSNIILAGDLNALVIQQASSGIEVIHDSAGAVIVRVAAGQDWHSMVEWTLEQGYFGLENLALIPGSVGAAPIQNIGAYGVELNAFVESVHALNIDTMTPVSLNNAECNFAYRDSIFKRELRDQLVITAVDLRLSRSPSLQLSYPALEEHFAARPDSTLSPRAVFDAIVTIRRSKLPDPETSPNAGSFFKNPTLSYERAAYLKLQYPDLPTYRQTGEQVKLSAGWMIDRCGWKGFRERGVGVHPEHALVLVNYGNESGARLLDLADNIRQSVAAEFGVELEFEPRIYGAVR